MSISYLLLNSGSLGEKRVGCSHWNTGEGEYSRVYMIQWGEGLHEI